MGYETRLYIGRVLGEREKNYFIKDASVDLCRCGDGELMKIIESAGSKENNNQYKTVYWSDQFKINEEKVIPTLKKEGYDLEDEYGDGIYDIFNTIEGWESQTTEDKYGSPLRAVPINVVYNAMKADYDLDIEVNDFAYRRYTIGLAMLKGFMDTFHEGNIFVVLYGH